MTNLLPSGLTVDLSTELLLRFCREEWAYYDGVPDRDPYRILPDDVTVTVAMNSFVDTADKVRTVHRGWRKPVTGRFETSPSTLTSAPSTSTER